jgi:hypothetical protein
MSPVNRACALLVFVAVGAACGGPRRSGDIVAPQLALEVYNSSFYEVTVYSLLATSGPRMRLGTATSYVTTKLPIPNNAYRPGGSLVLQLHAIGANRWWTTPELPLAWDLTPCLEIMADASGNMSRSFFFSVMTPDSLPPPGSRRSICGFTSTVSVSP